MMGRGAMGFRVWGRSGQGNREGSSPRRAAPWMGTQDATISATGCGFPHFASHPLPWGKWNTGLPRWRGALAGEKRGKAAPAPPRSSAVPRHKAGLPRLRPLSPKLSPVTVLPTGSWWTDPSHGRTWSLPARARQPLPWIPPVPLSFRL